jgi:hypothetical protein
MRGTPSTCRLQKNTPVATGTGSSDSWADLQAFQGVLIPVTQSEQKLADTDTAFDEYTLHIRKSGIRLDNRDEIVNTNRIVIGQRYYDIAGVANAGIRGGMWRLRLRDVTDQTEN